jgi:LEA14-like dessication related protein
METVRIGLVLFALSLLNGCSMGAKLQPPRLTLVAANMMSADVFSQQFRVRLHVANPNARELPVKSIEYQLFLEGDSFAEGTSAASFVVPANGEKEFDLIVHTNFVSSVGRLMARLNGTNKTSLDYTISGTVVADMTFSPKLKFAESGTVDLGRR